MKKNWYPPVTIAILGCFGEFGGVLVNLGKKKDFVPKEIYGLKCFLLYRESEIEN